MLWGELFACLGVVCGVGVGLGVMSGERMDDLLNLDCKRFVSFRLLICYLGRESVEVI